ncbi:hypothetical protein ACHAWF_012491 [Thalassiosira exigua]
MELLAGYNSSSSSSSSLPSVEAQQQAAFPRKRHDAVLSRGQRNALHVDASNNSPCAGGDCNRSSYTTDDDWKFGKEGSNIKAHVTGTKELSGFRRKRLENESGLGVKADDETYHVDKKRNICECSEDGQGTKPWLSAAIAGYNHGGNCDESQKFERNLSHWEGRWAGHLHLPFPPLERLDLLEGDANGNAASAHDSQGSSDRKWNKEQEGHEDEISGCSSSDEESNGSSEDGDDISRHFLPAARKLIHYWALLIGGDITCAGECCGTTVIVPHIPMQPIAKHDNTLTSGTKRECSLSASSLHISLARPIYLPSPSVGPFLEDIEKSLNAAISLFANGANSGRTLDLKLHNATIFTNDQQTRSFLAIPVSKESAHWVKQLLLPPIDAAMLRFGLETYYSSEEEGCILHVSVASVKGNIIPPLMKQRHDTCIESLRDVKHIPLFKCRDGCHDRLMTENAYNSESEVLESLPETIPITVNKIKCEFGKAKQLTIPF